MPPKASTSASSRQPRSSTAPRQSIASAPIRNAAPGRAGAASTNAARTSKDSAASASQKSSVTTPTKASQGKRPIFDSPAFADELDGDDSGLLTLKPNDLELAAMSLADSPSPRKPRTSMPRKGARPSWGPQPAAARSNLRLLRDLDDEPINPLRSRVSIFTKHSLVSAANEDEGDETVLRGNNVGVVEDGPAEESFMHELGGSQEEEGVAIAGTSGKGVEPATVADEPPTNPDQEESEAYVQQQLHQLKRMNQVFESYEGMLQGSLSQIGLFADRIDHTNALLDKYIDLLRQAEKTQSLLLDTEWKGASEDAAAHALSVELAERAHREAEAREAALAEAAAARAKAAALEASKRAHAAEVEEERRRRGGSAMRGRGTTTRGAASRGVGRSVNATVTARGASNAAPRPTATTSAQGRSRIPTQPSTSGTTTRSVPGASGGLGGRYAAVRSSGYGPQ